MFIQSKGMVSVDRTRKQECTNFEVERGVAPIVDDRTRTSAREKDGQNHHIQPWVMPRLTWRVIRVDQSDEEVQVGALAPRTGCRSEQRHLLQPGLAERGSTRVCARIRAPPPRSNA